MSPYVATKFPGVDLVIVRENEEDLYAGIEYRQTNDVYECLKLISRSGSERIVRYAFEFAKKFGRKKVSCLSKDNIMKMTDGLFHQVFNEIAQEYPNIAHDHYIVDIGTALIASDPERFDVIVTENLYGDIISDVAAQVVGSVGLAGSANVGDSMAMFEAIHGSAPDIAGKQLANPSGLLNAAIQMLIHIGEPQVAATIENAWLKTLEDGMHTADIYGKDSCKQCGTAEFAKEVIARLGQLPCHFTSVAYSAEENRKIVCVDRHDATSVRKHLVGVDVYFDEAQLSAEALAEKLKTIDGELTIEVITNRGVKVWPDGAPETHISDHWRCRFLSAQDRHIKNSHIIALLTQIDRLGVEVIKTENLYYFDEERGFTLAQGQ